MLKDNERQRFAESLSEQDYMYLYELAMDAIEEAGCGDFEQLLDELIDYCITHGGSIKSLMEMRNE